MEYKREQIGGPFKVLVRVPKNAKPGSVPGTDVSYLQFPCFKGGKCVNFFVHTKQALCGKKVLFDMTVWRRTRTDGKWMVHVDLRPAQGEATHFFRVENAEDVDRWRNAEEFKVFSNEHPIRLLVVKIGTKEQSIQYVEQTENKPFAQALNELQEAK